MKHLSIPEIVELTRISRITVTKRLGDMEWTQGEGKGSPKLYESSQALLAVLVGDLTEGTKGITQAEATRRLTVAREIQVKAETEVTQRKRWPREDVEAMYEESRSNIAGLIKAHEGKTLTPQLIEDIFTELRSVNVHLAKL